MLVSTQQFYEEGNKMEGCQFVNFFKSKNLKSYIVN